MIRFLLASIAAKRGQPSSAQCRDLRREQTRVATLPTTAELARVAISRLSLLTRDEGLSSLDQVLLPVTVVEATECNLSAGQVLADRLGEEVRRWPALEGLALAAQGISLSPEQQAREDRTGARRFLGWTTEKHWLLSQ